LTLPTAETVAGLIQKHHPGDAFASSYAGRDLAAALSQVGLGAIADVGISS
jgi:hypothetical protein